MPRAKRVLELEQCAKHYGGRYTEFSQSWTDITQQTQLAAFYNDKTQTFSDALYVGGMCHTMVMYWLALKKQGGKDFFEWLRPGGQWDKGAINVLVVKTVMYKNNKNKLVPDSVHQDFDERFFSMYGLHADGEKLSGFNNIQLRINSHREGYHMINLHCHSGAHCIAACTTAEGESAFFDSNYGEFHFSPAIQLGLFFNQFMRISRYAWAYTLRQTIRSYC